MDPQLLGIDIGGSVVKAAVFDLAGILLAHAADRSIVVADAPGHAERDPELMWQSAASAIRAVLAEPTVDPAAIAAVGVTGFGNGLFLVDRNGAPTRFGIASFDTRAASIVKEWREAGLEEMMWATTLQPFWSGQPLPLLEWVRRHDPDALAGAHRVLHAKDVLRFRLTGELCTDRTDLGSGGLFDPAGGGPAYGLFAELGLGKVSDCIPEGAVAGSADLVGTVTAEAARATGLPPGVPVVAGVTDNLSVLVGSGTQDVGSVFVIGGTWSINQALSASHVTDRSVFQSFPTHRDEVQLLVESNPNSMSNFDWFARSFVKTPPGWSDAQLYDHCNEQVQSADMGPDDSLTFLPHLYGTPRNPARTGALLGVTGDIRPAQVLRAIYEGVAFEHRTLVERLHVADAGGAVRVAGGIVRSNTWLQLFADVLGRPIETPDIPEVGGRGVAMLAAVGAGLYPDFATATLHMTRSAATIEPRPERSARLDERYERYRGVRELTFVAREPGGPG